MLKPSNTVIIEEIHTILILFSSLDITINAFLGIYDVRWHKSLGYFQTDADT
jgi:hypothetical protein